MKNIKKIKKEKDYFFNFDRRLFPKKARTYHHEVQHATLDLIDVYNRVDRTYLLCERNVKILMRARKGWLSRFGFETDFESLTYHLENFWLRAFSYREKFCQLINAALDLRFSEKSSLFYKLCEDSVVRKSSVKIELEKFNKNKAFSEILMIGNCSLETGTG